MSAMDGAPSHPTMNPYVVELRGLSQDEMSINPTPERRDSSVSVLSFSEDGIDTLGWETNRRRSSDVSLGEDGIDTLGWGAGNLRDTTESSESPGSVCRVSSPSSTPPGPGPLRFAPGPYQRSVAAQVEDLFAHERCCYDSIKSRWENSRGTAFRRMNEPLRRRTTQRRRSSVEQSRGFTDAQYLHFARSANFDEEGALRLMRSANRRYLRLTCEALEAQLRTKTIFIPPGLQTREGYDVFYMRPSRYFPKQMQTSDVIDNLAYVMQVMLERERSSKEGITFLANMSGWEMANFSTGYCLQFMKTLQAEHFPVEVRTFLIVDPPSWFGKIWSIMKKMLTADFQKRVRMIPSSELGGYLGDGYDRFLPDEMEGGTSSTDDMVADFIAYRKYMESVAK